MDYNFGKITGQLYAVLHFGLSEEDQRTEASSAATQFNAKDVDGFVQGWVDGYQLVDQQKPSADTN